MQYAGDMEEWMPVSSSEATNGVHYYWRYAIAPYLGIQMNKEKVSDNNLKICGKTPVFWCEKTIPPGTIRDWDVLSYGLGASDQWEVSGWGKNPDQRKCLNCIKGKSPSQTVVTADKHRCINFYINKFQIPSPTLRGVAKRPLILADMTFLTRLRSSEIPPLIVLAA